MQEKAKFVCFIYMQPQKVKLKSVQILMKQVSYCRVLQVDFRPSLMIKLPIVIKIFVLSIFKWPFYTGFTVIPFQFYHLSVLRV